MPIIRVEKTSNYTVMANYHFREKGLSLKAKGLMSLMLSLPDDWDYSVEGLATLSKDGIDSVRSALRELEEFKYLTMERERDSKGVLHGTIYTLHEKPEKPIMEKPILDKPRLGKPILENPTQLNTNPLSTKKQSTDKQITPPRPKDPFAVDSPELAEALKGYEASRKAMHKPLTLRAKTLTLNKLRKMAPGNEELQIAILDQSVERGWQGIFPLKQDYQRKTGGTGIPQFDVAARAIEMINNNQPAAETDMERKEREENERIYNEWLREQEAGGNH